MERHGRRSVGIPAQSKRAARRGGGGGGGAPLVGHQQISSANSSHSKGSELLEKTVLFITPQDSQRRQSQRKAALRKPQPSRRGKTHASKKKIQFSE